VLVVIARIIRGTRARLFTRWDEWPRHRLCWLAPMAEKKVRIGISGWRYTPWRGLFYPSDLPQRAELEFASSKFPTIELNGSFYSLQRPSHFARWARETPKDFVFSIKGGRFITHILRLRDARQALANFFAQGLFELGPKLGPFLWQLPPSLRYDEALIDAFLGLLPRTTAAAAKLAASRDAKVRGRARLAYDASRRLRHAIEVRHESFATTSFIRLLRRHRVAVVFADTAGRWPWFDDLTSDFVYLRLHGDEELYASGYTDEALDRWARRIRIWRRTRDVYCYFDNDVKVHAPHDAHALMRRLGLMSAQDALPRKPPRSRKKVEPVRGRWVRKEHPPKSNAFNPPRRTPQAARPPRVPPPASGNVQRPARARARSRP
jgi:uncharacterized protein YecE (DUF72 family)